MLTVMPVHDPPWPTATLIAGDAIRVREWSIQVHNLDRREAIDDGVSPELDTDQQLQSNALAETRWLHCTATECVWQRVRSALVLGQSQDERRMHRWPCLCRVVRHDSFPPQKIHCAFQSQNSFVDASQRLRLIDELNNSVLAMRDTTRCSRTRQSQR